MSQEEFNAMSLLWGESNGLSVPEEIEQKKNRSRVKNRESSMRGQAFEELITLQCRKYKEQGIAVIDKTPEPFRVYRKRAGGMFEGRFTGTKAQPDFQGTLKGGQSILIEAKSTSKDRISFGVLTEHQRELLEQHKNAGAVCLVLCEIEGRHFSVPWVIWKNMKALYGHLYVTSMEIKEYEVIEDTGEVFPFLKVLDNKMRATG